MYLSLSILFLVLSVIVYASTGSGGLGTIVFMIGLGLWVAHNESKK